MGNKLKEIVCECCKEKSYGSANSRYCPDCALIAKYIRRKRADHDLPSISHSELVEEVRKEMEKRGKTNQITNYCFYCEKALPRGTIGYCYACRMEGLDYLHRATGRTKKDCAPKVKKTKPLVKAGWRGQPVLGGATEMIRTINVCL